MDRDRYEELSIFISLVLRHKPEVIGIELDEFGYANINELINGINKSGRKINMGMLEHIVFSDSKKRYSFSGDLDKIRANQGHSIPVKVEMSELEPPEFLFHGTSTRNIKSIEEQGIKRMKRLHVHLSDNMNTAITVGKRHGEPLALKIKAKEMFNSGYKFYLSENKVWLTDFIPNKYIIKLGE